MISCKSKQVLKVVNKYYTYYFNNCHQYYISKIEKKSSWTNEVIDSRKTSYTAVNNGELKWRIKKEKYEPTGTDLQR